MRVTRVTGIEALERDDGADVTFCAGRRRYPFRLDETLVSALESTLQGLGTPDVSPAPAKQPFVARPWDASSWLTGATGSKPVADEPSEEEVSAAEKSIAAALGEGADGYLYECARDALIAARKAGRGVLV